MTKYKNRGRHVYACCSLGHTQYSQHFSGFTPLLSAHPSGLTPHCMSNQAGELEPRPTRVLLARAGESRVVAQSGRPWSALNLRPACGIWGLRLPPCGSARLGLPCSLDLSGCALELWLRCCAWFSAPLVCGVCTCDWWQMAVLELCVRPKKECKRNARLKLRCWPAVRAPPGGICWPSWNAMAHPVTFQQKATFCRRRCHRVGRTCWFRVHWHHHRGVRTCPRTRRWTIPG